MTKRKLRIGIIGAGRIANRHVEAYLDLSDKVEIVGIADVDIDRAREKAKEWGVPFFSCDYSDVIEAKNVDAVDICVPHDLHLPVAKKACQCRKDIFIEKPMARTVQEADEIIQATQRANVRLMVGHNFLFNPLVEKVKSVIDADIVGEVRLVKAVSLGWYLFQKDDFRLSPERSGGGTFIDTGSHFVYLVRELVGEIKSVVSIVGNSSREEMSGEDIAVVLLRFQSGALGEITISYSTILPGWRFGAPIGWDQRLEIYGTEGAIRLNLTAGELSLWSNQENMLGEGWLSFREPYDYHSSFKKEITHFVESLLGNTEFRISPNDGKRVLEIVSAVYKSASTHKEVNV